MFRPERQTLEAPPLICNPQAVLPDGESLSFNFARLIQASDIFEAIVVGQTHRFTPPSRKKAIPKWEWLWEGPERPG